MRQPMKKDQGQVMLTSAFLLAIAIIIVTIMLNNLIYSNNVAYYGFSDQSQYDGSSIKMMTVDELNYANNVAHEDQSMFTRNFTAFVNATNNVTLTKGIYVKNTSLAFTSGHISQQLYVCDRNSNKSYVINSNSQTPQATVTYHGGRNPGNVIVRLGTNDTTPQLGEHVLLIVEVVNSTTYMPEPNVTVNFTLPAGALMANGNEYIADANGNIKGKDADLHTDDNGHLFVEYYLTSLVSSVKINASVGSNPSQIYGNLSNNVTMTLVATTTETPTPTPTPTPNPTPEFDHLTITVTDPWSNAGGTMTVTALDQFGNVYPGYTGKVYFSSNNNNDAFTYDKKNNEYQFTVADGGTHVFANSATLSNGNNAVLIHLITVTDPNNNKQAQDTATYTTPVFDHLTLTVTDPWPGSSGILTVTAYDQLGNVYTDYTGSVYFSSNVTNDAFTYNNIKKQNWYQFTSTDKGTHVFANSATLVNRNGKTHLITVTDQDNKQAQDTTLY